MADDVVRAEQPEQPADAPVDPQAAADERRDALSGLGPVALARSSKDVRTLIALLAGECRFAWLVGHSKGNLVLSEALYAICCRAPARFAELTRASDIVTVSAAIQMPRGPWRIIDVMGEMDGFAGMNSRRAIPIDVEMPFAWHHANTELPFHLPVTPTLRASMDG